jgi:hypothetical protein
MSRPLTRKEWLAFLKKACDEFDWESAGQKREWVGLTLDEKKEYLAQDFGGSRADAMDWAEQRLKEKNCG